MTEYSPLPGTLRSNTLEVTDEPWTKNTTGRAGSPALGAPIRLRNIHNGMSPFLVQYSLLQISPPSVGTAVALSEGDALAIPPATRPSPAPLIPVRRASNRSICFMVSSGQFLIFSIFLRAATPASVADGSIAGKSRCAAARKRDPQRRGLLPTNTDLHSGRINAPRTPKSANFREPSCPANHKWFWRQRCCAPGFQPGARSYRMDRARNWRPPTATPVTFY